MCVRVVGLPGSGLQAVTDPALEQPVPRRVEADLVDAVAVAVEGHQLGVELVGEHPVLAGLGRAGLLTEVQEGRHGVGRRVPLDRLDERGIGGDGVVSHQRGSLVAGYPVVDPHGLTVVLMAAESSSRPGARTLSWEVVRATVWRLIVSTVGTCMRNRVTGLAAEAAFFAVLSLPPLIFALAGSIGYIFAQFSDSQIGEVRNTVLDIASQALTPQTVDSIIRPDAQRGPERRRSLRRRLDRVHPRAVVGLARAQRLRRHHHDHVRPRRAPRHRPDPRPVVPALRARHDHRRRHDPAGGRRSDADREVAARAVRLAQRALLADRARARHPLPRARSTTSPCPCGRPGATTSRVPCSRCSAGSSAPHCCA